MVKKETIKTPASVNTGMALIKTLISESKSKADIRKQVMTKCNWGKTKTYDIIRKVEKSGVKPKQEKPKLSVASKVQVEEPQREAIVYNKNYTYNKTTGQYIFRIANKNHLFSRELIDSIIRDYTCGEKTASELSNSNRLPLNIIRSILMKLEVTHGGSPISKETLEELSPEEAAKTILEYKKLAVDQLVEKREWSNIQSNSDQWLAFQSKKVDPFARMLEGWTPTTIKPINYCVVPRKNNKETKRSFIVGAFDWHIGSYVAAKRLNRGREWNVNVAQKAIEAYAQAVYRRVMADPIGFDKGIIILGGDLFHTVTGRTGNGTELKCDIEGNDQFIKAEELTRWFIDALTPVFEKLEVHFVEGNHGTAHDIPLARVLNAVYEKHPKVTFKYYESRSGIIRIHNVLFGFEHGASGYTKSVLNGSKPSDKPNKSRNEKIHSVFASYPIEKMIGVKQKVYFVGDRHCFEHCETGEFEFIQSGGLPTGDFYADTLGLTNKPRQNALILNENSLEAVLHFYVEEDEENKIADV